MQHIYNTKKTTWLSFDRLVGVLAPNICLGCGVEGEVLCRQCLMSAGEPMVSRCAGCRALTNNSKTCSSCRSWLDVFSINVATAYEGFYEQLLHDYKFSLKRRAAEPIAAMMAEAMPRLHEDFVICPLPTASSRIRQRGFDHAKLLAKTLHHQMKSARTETNWQLNNLLMRRTNIRQLGSSRAQRIKQMKQEFYVKKGVNVTGKTVMLIDDVVTTGASLSAAAKTLKDAGAKRVYAVVFAQKV